MTWRLDKGELYDGHNVKYWANKYNVTIHAIYGRIQRHNSPHEFRYVSRNQESNIGRNPNVFFEGKTAKQWADDLGVHINTVRNRLKQGKHPNKFISNYG
jgi:sugar diacid utilization regulator